jgi:hypothetical protein
MAVDLGMMGIARIRSVARAAGDLENCINPGYVVGQGHHVDIIDP